MEDKGIGNGLPMIHVTRKLWAPALVIASIMGLGHASVLAQNDPEIEHLMVFVATSQCRFIRNGKMYDAAQSRKHLERKYRHIQHAIGSADEFIEKVASRSSVTGRPYRVQCSDREVPTATWLRDELGRFRTSGPKR